MPQAAERRPGAALSETVGHGAGHGWPWPGQRKIIQKNGFPNCWRSEYPTHDGSSRMVYMQTFGKHDWGKDKWQMWTIYGIHTDPMGKEISGSFVGFVSGWSLDQTHFPMFADGLCKCSRIMQEFWGTGMSRQSTNLGQAASTTLYTKHMSNFEDFLFFIRK